MSERDVEIGGRFGRLYRLLDWPVRLAGLNLLWLVGVLAGGVVAGASPATVALFALLREYLLGRRPQPWHDFWRRWRAEFGRSQVRLGLPLLTVWVLLFYLLAARGTWVAIPVAVLGGAYLLALAYLPAVLAHFELPATAAWRVAALVAWRGKLWTAGLSLALLLVIAVMVFVVPAAIPFFLPSLPAVMIMLVALRVFESLTGPLG